MESLKLIKTETGLKASKFLYQIIDENGNVISSRKSNREYVAATKFGEFYFGRIDLIGKGDHGRTLKHLNENQKNDELKRFNTIAYL